MYGLRSTDQIEVAFVQGPHSWDHADRMSIPAGLGGPPGNGYGRGVEVQAGRGFREGGKGPKLGFRVEIAPKSLYFCPRNFHPLP